MAGAAPARAVAVNAFQECPVSSVRVARSSTLGSNGSWLPGTEARAAEPAITWANSDVWYVGAVADEDTNDGAPTGVVLDTREIRCDGFRSTQTEIPPPGVSLSVTSMPCRRASRPT